MSAKREIRNGPLMLMMLLLLLIGGALVAHVDGHSIRREDMQPVPALDPPEKFVWTEDESPLDDDGDDFFVPSPQEVEEFQQILLKGLGLSQAPDMSKANVSRDEYDRVYADYQRELKQSKDRQLVNDVDYDSPLQREHLLLTPDSVTVFESRVKSGRRRSASREWALHFRPRLAPAQSSWSVESPRLEVRWISRSGSDRADREALQSGGLSIRLEVVNEATPMWTSDNVIEADLRTDKWLEQQSLTFDLSRNLIDWSERNSSLQFRMICAGRACGILAGYHLSSQLRMDLVENGLTRTKRSKQLKDILKLHHKKNRSEAGGDCTKDQKKCCRKSLKVKFRDLDAFSWIVEPRVADLYMCKGQCKYPHHIANNHALLQGFMHHRDKTKAPKLCCTPSKLEGLKVLYVRNDDPTKLAVAEWDNAVVTECACS